MTAFREGIFIAMSLNDDEARVQLARRGTKKNVEKNGVDESESHAQIYFSFFCNRRDWQ